MQQCFKFTQKILNATMLHKKIKKNIIKELLTGEQYSEIIKETKI